MKTLKSLIKKHKINNEYVTYYTNDKAKISISALNDSGSNESKLILVTAMTPTPKGEGKTTISIGLADGLNYIGQNAVLALREPSLGPVFGLKGGAIGGGKTTIIPSSDINLHFNGDFHAITSAHNLLSAAIDNHIYFGNSLEIDEVLFPRTIDMNDRNLREIETPLGKRKFVITAASEIMAIIALCESVDDLKNRLGDIIVGLNHDGKFIYARELGCIEAMAILLKDAIKPNVVRSQYGSLAFVHAGPFANVAHGCNSILATRMALKYGDYTITEAGFGSDLGAEKFFDIKVPILGKAPNCIVMVATIQAIKYHGSSESENDPIRCGLKNLEHHIQTIKQRDLPFVIALNIFDCDLESEIEIVEQWATKKEYIISRAYGFIDGAKGCVDLANKVIKQCVIKPKINALYNLSQTIPQKIEIIAKNVYGANGVVFSKKALRKMDLFKEFNYPVCIAKTPLSLSDNPKLLNNPKDFDIHIQDIWINNGSKLIVCLTNGIVTLPGLNEHPRYEKMMLCDDGEIIL